MRDRFEEFTSRGVNVVAIGMGTPAMAADFKEQFRVPFQVLVDRTKESYRIPGLKRATVVDAVRPRVLLRGARSVFRRGQGRPQQDPAQLGGAVVVDRNGTILFVHRADDAQDNVPVDDLLAALP